MAMILFVFVLWAAVAQASSSYTNKHLFYVDQSAGAIQQITSSKTPFSTWTTPTAINTFGISTTSQVGAINEKTTLHVFYQNNLGQVVTQAYQTSWNNGQPIVNYTLALAGTALAGANYPETDSAVQLYFQDQNNNIRQVVSSNGNGWSVTDESTFSEPALANTAITAIAWNNKEIRVFYVGTDNEIYQVSHTSSGWSSPTSILTDGTFPSLGSVYLFPSSGTSYDVYFVDTIDYALHGLDYKSTWGSTTVIYSADPIPGGIATLHDNTSYVYAYFQNPSYDIIELYLSSGTYTGGPLSQSVSGATYIAGALF